MYAFKFNVVNYFDGYAKTVVCALLSDMHNLVQLQLSVISTKLFVNSFTFHNVLTAYLMLPIVELFISCELYKVINK